MINKLSQLRHQSYVTYTMLGLNIIIFLLMMVLPLVGIPQSTLINLGGVFRPFVVGYGQWYRLLTAGFIHLNFQHLLFNMMALYFVGIELEQILGHGRFAFVYFSSLFGGSLLSLALAGPLTLSVGASTAIFGVFASYIVLGQLYPYSEYLSYRARNYALLIVINLLMNLFATNTDMWGHIGGAIAGMLATGSVGIRGINISRKNGILWFLVLIGYGIVCVLIALNKPLS